jgi:hemerythrin
MPVLPWNQGFSVFIKKFDDQHKQLVNLINQLHDAMIVGKGREALGEILQSLAEYTSNHFRDEEMLMKLHGYDGYEDHKKEHNMLIVQVKEKLESFRQGNNIVTHDVMSFLRNWLTQHIMDVDKKYGPFLNSKGIV